MLYNLKDKKYYPLLIYIIGLFIALSSVNYFYYLQNQVGGVHFWRATDSASFVAYYYENGMRFFDTGTYNLDSKEGRAASEFPILYYITAALWHLFGRSDMTLKILTGLIFFSGFYCFFKLAIQKLGNIYIALLLTLLLLSSPVLLSYCNKFIPDTSALGFSLIGIYFFFKFYQTSNYRYYLWAWAFFILASLLKVTVAIFPVAIFCLFITEYVFKINIAPKVVFSGNISRYLLPTLVLLLLVAGWVFWVIYYNNINSCYIFLTKYAPIWQSSWKKIVDDYNLISVVQYPYYYYFSTTHFIIITIAIGLLLWRQWQNIAKWFFVFLVLGSIAYGVLFYNQFVQHDYYMFPFAVFLSLGTLFSLAAIIKKARKYQKGIVGIIGAFLFIMNILSYNFAARKVESHNRYGNYSYMFQNPTEFVGKIEEYGIPKNATIISIPDPTPNGTLYIMQRKGYTSGGIPDYYVQKHINNAIVKGANYLVISSKKYYKFADSNMFTAVEVSKHPIVKVFKVTAKKN